VRTQSVWDPVGLSKRAGVPRLTGGRGSRVVLRHSFAVAAQPQRVRFDEIGSENQFRFQRPYKARRPISKGDLRSTACGFAGKPGSI
jgi:hypothetical protein